ncbi:dual oxidase maturation factor 1-like [Rhinophrynus dorsalis]
MHGDVFPFYPRPRTSFLFDTKVIEIIIICIVTACTFIIILPGIRGKLRPIWLLRVLTSLCIGAVILAVNFTVDWEVGSVTATTVYKSFSHTMVNVSIGLWIGLKGINITLAGNPVYQINETINYNEEFEFGSFSVTHFDNDYNEGLEKGLPIPILYVAEKFIYDNPCGLHRQYCVSAYYSSALMWVAFCCWILCNILFSMSVILYGIYMMLATALCVFISLISFVGVRRTQTCSIQFGNSTLQTKLGISFWLSLAIGLFCLTVSLVLMTIYKTKPNMLRTFFNYGEDEDFADNSDSEEGCISDNMEIINLHQISKAV